MDRRDAIGRIALLMGGAVIGAEYFLSGCKPSGSSDVATLFKPENTAYLDLVADTILPDTPSSPGAKAAGVGAFMAVMVRDCYTPADQKTFLEGMDKLNDAAKKQSGGNFVDLPQDKRTTLLIALDKEQKQYYQDLAKKASEDMIKHKGDPNFHEPDQPNHYFRMMKEMTLLGYFTSEVGATKALRYIETPGHFDGCIPYKKGDKAWMMDDF